MKQSLQKVLSFVLVFVMVLGMIPFAAFANEAQQASASNLPTSMEGLSISYPYNTETVKQTGSVPNRFSALTFESARNEVESAQMILSPNFAVDSFKLTMGSLQNEKGNIIPSWAFEVYVQHYVSISGAGNAPYWTKDSWLGGTEMFKPRGGESGKGASGVFPDALIPMDAAITAGENKVSAGKNGGLWVNLDVQNAAPGTYTGFATLNVNGTDMQIPVSVRVYDVEVPEEVHMESCFPIWWDQLQGGEGYIDRNLADAYFAYLVSKRVMPMDAWNITRWDDSFAAYAASYLAVSPEISSYSINFTKKSDGTLDTDALKATFNALIDKNLELAAAGSDADLFKKAYMYLYDEPETNAEYKDANNMTAQMDAVKNELAYRLDAYPELKASFLGIKNIVTAQHPDDTTYDKMWQDVGSTKLTGSYIYCPQFQYLNTAAQRAYYANEESVWWYGCCFPTEPFPTYHINSPLIAARATGWMMYDYNIDGMLYSAVNYWGKYNNDGSITQLSYWTGYTDNGTPGDGMLVYPGSDYGVYGPIGTIRLENIREGNEDYEYLWLLGEEYGQDISAYTNGLYEGVIVTGVYDGQTIDPDGDGNTDAITIHYNNRKALLTKLEQLNIAENGATEIAPGQEGFVRGEAFTAGENFQVDLDQTKTAAGLSLDYKITDGAKIGVALLSDWSNFYGYYNLYAEGVKDAYEGVYVEMLDDGYVRVIFDLSALTVKNGAPTPNLDLLFVRGANTSASGYIDKVQLLDEIPEIAPPVTYRGEEIVAGTSHSVYFPEAAAYDVVTFDMIVPAEGGENEIGFCLYQDGSNYLGYFYLEKTGLENKYAGVSAEQLDDGYWRVTLDVDQITDSARVHGQPTIFDRIYIRNHTTGGYIDNVQCFIEEPVEETYTISSDLQIDVEDGSYDYISFEYQITNDGVLYIAALSPDWGKYYGYYEFDANGKRWEDEGVYCTDLGDGYYRVTLKAAEMRRTNDVYDTINAPETIGLLYINGRNSATGIIRNVQVSNTCIHNYESVVTAPAVGVQGYTTHTCVVCGDSYVDSYVDALEPEAAQEIFDGGQFVAGSGITISLDNSQAVTKMSFDYKLTSDGYMNVALLPDWSSYFGYFKLDSNGESGDYAGVTTQKIANGYIRVFIDLAEVNYIAGTPSDVITMIYVRGSYTTADGIVENIRINSSAYEPLRGNALTPGVNQQIDLDATEEIATLSFDYLITDDGKIGMALLPDWSNYFGYYNFTADGPAGNYPGITAEVLEDGYVHVTMKLDELTSISGSPSKIIDFIYVRGGYTTANGYIDNVQYTLGCSHKYETVVTDADCVNGGYTTYTCSKCGDSYVADEVAALGHNYESVVTDPTATEQGYTTHTCTRCGDSYVDSYTDPVPPKEVFDGSEFVANSGVTIVLDNSQAVTKMSFDYKLTSDGYMNVALLPDWSSYFGYFKLDGNGESGDYAGVTVQKIEDGYMRVFIDLEEVTNLHSAPSDIITMIYVRGSYTTADGVVENIRINSSAYEPMRGNALTPGVNQAIDLDATEEIATLSFDYLITDDGNIGMALLPNWSSYFGYYNFTADGPAGNYPGITAEVLEDGYVHITMELDKLTSKAGDPSKIIDFIYVRGEYTTANGYIDNVQYTLGCSHSYETVVTAPTFEANGYTTYTCSKCGNSYVADEVAAYTFEISQWGITLADDIRADFSLNVDSRIADATVQITVGSVSLSKELSTLGNEVSVNVAAAQMTDEISIQVIYGEAISAEKTYTIRQYAEYILNGEYDDDIKALVQNMLHYGAAAQNYFGYNTDDLANKGYEITDVPTIPEAEAGSVAAGTVEGISYYGASLLFQSKIGVRFYFTVTGDINNYTFSNGATPVAKSGMYYVDVLDINPNDYSQTIELSVTDGADTLTVGYSPMRYISRKYHGSDDAKLQALVAAMYQYHLAAVDYLTEEPEAAYRGQEIVTGHSLSVMAEQAANYSQVILDMIVPAEGGENEIGIALLDANWNYYGYFYLEKTGLENPYAGVSAEQLSDGYWRVTITIDEITDPVRIHGDVGMIERVYINKHTTGGYIDNVQFVVREEPEVTEPVIRGKAFSAGSNSYIYTDSTDEMTKFSFEYKVTNDGAMDVLIGNDNGQYGNFYLNADGTITSVSDTTAMTYAGVTTETLADGYIRVTFQLDALENVYRGTPGFVIGFIRIRATSTAEGYVDKVVWESAQTDVIRGEAFAAGSSLRIHFDAGVYSTVTFDYKITSDDGVMQFALLDSNGSLYYGRFKVNATGEEGSYNGVEVKALSDGYYRVTVTIADVTDSNGTPADLMTLYIRGSGTTASGYIDNLTLV